MIRSIACLTVAIALPISNFAAEGSYAGPQRVNKAIELLAAGQPVYYSYGEGGYDEGREAAKTWADILMYDMKGHALDFTQLREFMRGLVDGGPTPSGHRTPAVIVTLPLYGLGEDMVLANHWMIQQALACGIHGLHLCHARDANAVRAFVRAARYEVNRQGVGEGLEDGLRMFGAHKFASWVWGVETRSYYDLADVWPLNPDGQLLFGVKIEDPEGLLNTESIVRVPGLAFAEWGPRDTSYAHGFFDVAEDYGRKPGVVAPPPLQAAADRVIRASKEAGIQILDNVRPEDVVAQIEAGILIGAGGIEDAAEAGRKHTGRRMPW
ncbi:MAG: aldolase/citrate lyase family protein [Opitutaceae bacterium]